MKNSITITQVRAALVSIVLLSSIVITFQNCGNFELSDTAHLASVGEMGKVSFQSEYGQEAKAILVKHCAACHGIETGGSGGFSDMFNLKHLLDSGFVVPGNPKASKLYQSIATGRMPTEKKLSDVEASTINYWILGLTDRNGKCTPVAQQKKTNPEKRLWRLTKLQVENSIRDIFGKVYSAAPILPDDVAYKGFANDQGSLTVKEQYARNIKKFAEKVAAGVARYDVDKLQNANKGEIKIYLTSTARLLFRRPLTFEEVNTYLSLFELGSDSKEGVQLALEAMLQSPHFWYRRELNVNGNNKLYEVASRLSFTIWNRAPDEELLDLAESGELAGTSIFDAQLDRLLNSEKGNDFLVRFIEEWFQVNEMKGKSITTGNIVNSTAVSNAMVEEAKRFISNVVENQDSRLETLFSSNKTFINKDLAAFYQSSIQSSEFQQHNMDGVIRSGILTLPGVIAAISAGGLPYVKRGVFIRSELLCQPFPTPPIAVMNEEDKEPLPTDPREIAAHHSKNPACKTCHAMIDPIGFGMSKYDEYGMFSPFKDSKDALDDTAELRLTVNVDGDYSGIVPLSNALGKSRDLQLCSSEKMFRYMFGRDIEDSDRCDLSIINDRYKESGYNLKELVKAYLDSDLFNKRGK